MNEPRVNIPEWTVSELSAALKRTVEDAYGFVRVRGEITGYRGPHSSGHCYFALKDEGAKIDAVIWRTALGRIRFKPEEGLEVIATGRLTTYPGRSSYQIVIESLEPAGVDAFVTVSRGVLSHYGKEATLWVKSPRGEVPIGEYTPLYERYAEAATLARLYVEPERWDEARRLLTLE